MELVTVQFTRLLNKSIHFTLTNLGSAWMVIIAMMNLSQQFLKVVSIFNLLLLILFQSFSNISWSILKES
uniref:Transmembrane protein n=1 Tax=Medicago truncatula TaxID=3880 RepID=I3S2F9_MEDTR|nr:unknown [Medicago truncatula]